MRIQELIDGLDITRGRTKRIDCPRCGGSGTLSVTDDCGKRLYNCFRAGCGLSGSRDSKYSHEDFKQWLEQGSSTQTQVAPEFILPAHFKYEFTKVDRYRSYHTYLDIKENRRVFLVRDKEGRVVDAVGRSISGVRPKWKRYASSTWPFVTDWSLDTVVVVEDVISAIAVANATPYCGAALLGTNLFTGVPSLFSGFQKGVVALDYDASAKAVGLVKKLNWYLPTRCVIIKEDLKHYSDEKIRGVLGV